MDEHFVLNINHAEKDLAAVAPLLCAGITTWSPLRHWGAGPGKKVGIVDWAFNAWGGKYPPYEDDDAVPTCIAQELKLPVFYPGIVMEGGSVDFNGRDSAGNKQLYARLGAQITDPTSTSEDAILLLQAVVAPIVTENSCSTN